MKDDRNEHVLISLSKRYPQLLLPIDASTPSSEEYKSAVLRGNPLHREPDFSLSDDDWLRIFETPAGKVEVLFLSERSDFEHALRALAYRCAPREIPSSVGASTLIGLSNWEKIHTHKRQYLLSGGTDWSAEFRRFTAEKSNYQDIIILLSNGPYSAVPGSQLGLPEDQWLEKSLTIRCYHELTHFVCRKLYPDDIEAIRDEVLADLMGVLAAFGRIDVDLVRLFLGIGNYQRDNGRLSYYASPDKMAEAIETAEYWLAIYADRMKKESITHTLDLITKVF